MLISNIQQSELVILSQHARLLCPWNSPGKTTGVGRIPFSRGLPNPGIESVLHCRWLLYQLNSQGIYIYIYIYIYICKHIYTYFFPQILFPFAGNCFLKCSVCSFFSSSSWYFTYTYVRLLVLVPQSFWGPVCCPYFFFLLFVLQIGEHFDLSLKFTYIFWFCSSLSFHDLI